MSAGKIVGLVFFLGLFIGVVSLIILAGRGAAKLAKELPDRVKRARGAKATILSIRKGAVQNRGSSVFSMRLELEVDDGGQTRQAPAFWEVRDIDIPQIQPGTVVDVKIDADEPALIYSPHFEASVGELAVVLDERRKAVRS